MRDKRGGATDSPPSLSLLRAKWWLCESSARSEESKWDSSVKTGKDIIIIIMHHIIPRVRVGGIQTVQCSITPPPTQIKNKTKNLIDLCMPKLNTYQTLSPGTNSDSLHSAGSMAQTNSSLRCISSLPPTV